MAKNQNPEVKKVDAAGSSAELGRQRRMKIGALSVVSILVVIAAVIAFNYFVDYIANRYVLEIDMTSESEYEISEETAQLLSTLQEPITITVLCNETDYESDEDLRRLPKVFQRYVQLSGGMVEVKYINAVTNPGIFKSYDKLGDLSTQDIIVESAKRYKALKPHDLLEYQTAQNSAGGTSQYVTGLRAEQRLTSAILYVIANKVPKASYITGHQETTNLEAMEGLLTSGNYDVDSVSLMQAGEIPSDVDMIIISQPKGDYTVEEINLIDEFLEGGGRAIVTFASDTPELPNLESYFEEWGVRYESQMVYDTERCFAGYNAYILPNVVTVEGLTENLDRNGYVVIPGARPISVLWQQDNWRGTQPLFTTSNSAYARDLSTESTAMEQTDSDATGPFNVGVLAYQNKMHNLNSTFSYVLFLNAGTLGDTALTNSAFINKAYFLSALNFMSSDSEAVSIESKDLTTDTLAITGATLSVLYYLLIFIIPGVCLILGILVWVRRRHK